MKQILILDVTLEKELSDKKKSNVMGVFAYRCLPRLILHSTALCEYRRFDIVNELFENKIWKQNSKCHGRIRLRIIGKDVFCAIC